MSILYILLSPRVLATNISLASLSLGAHNPKRIEPTLGSPLYPSSHPPIRIHPAQESRPTRMQAGLVTHLLLSTIAHSWLIDTPYPLPPSSRLLDDSFPEEIQFHLDEPGADLTTQTAAWACLDAMDSLFDGAKETQEIWSVPIYDMFQGSSTQSMGQLSLKSDVLPRAINGNETSVQGKQEDISKRLRSRRTISETASREDVITFHTQYHDSDGDLDIHQQFTGTPLGIRSILFLVYEFLRMLLWQRYATAPISDDFHGGEVISGDPTASGVRLEVTILGVESGGKEVRWIEMGETLRQILVEPIVRRQWDSFTAEAGFPGQEPFLKVDVFKG